MPRIKKQNIVELSTSKNLIDTEKKDENCNSSNRLDAIIKETQELAKVSKSKNKKAQNIIETEEKTKKKTTSNQIKISLTESDLFELTLPSNFFTIIINDNNFNVYACNSKSFIIVDKNNLNITYKKFFFNIKRSNNIYKVTTNQSIKLDTSVKIDDLSKEKDTISLTVKNLYKIFLENKQIHFEGNRESKELADIVDNNNLIISEKDQKVFLPYHVEDIKLEYESHKDIYTSLSDVINKKYILPISLYKHSITTRYKEAYTLMRERENKSVKDSVLLGLELMFEFNLHPAIITACKSLEELDIYLDCLDDNELDKFSCFNIIFHSLPTINTKKTLQPTNNI